MQDFLTYAIFGAYGLFALIEVIRPGRAFPRMAFWRMKGLASFALYFLLASHLPFLWDEWLGAHRLIDATGLGILGGAVVGFVLYELALYAWHRTMHRVPFLWRWFHQMHHSAERIDIFSALYFSPLDIFGFTFLGSFVLVFCFGISPESAVIVNFAATLLAFFQHANIKTPRWLGYVIQRPEQHQLHHGRTIHEKNYADLMVIDLLFGTFENPKRFEGEVGFYIGGSNRVIDMLLGRDVSQPLVSEVDPNKADAKEARTELAA